MRLDVEVSEEDLMLLHAPMERHGSKARSKGSTFLFCDFMCFCTEKKFALFFWFLFFFHRRFFFFGLLIFAFVFFPCFLRCFSFFIVHLAERVRSVV